MRLMVSAYLLKMDEIKKIAKSIILCRNFYKKHKYEKQECLL